MSKANGIDGKRYVSRSVWAKLKEENKRMIRDLKILCMNESNIVEYVRVRTKYREKFEQDNAFMNDIKEYALSQICPNCGHKAKDHHRTLTNTDGCPVTSTTMTSQGIK